MTIVKFCGKKTPLVHRRRRKRRSIHHTAAAEGDEEVGGLESITVHPTAVKANVPFLGKRYRIYKETRGRHRGGDADRRKSAKVPPPEGAASQVEEGVVRASNLARGLTKLIVALPPENSEETSTVPTSSREERKAS